MIDCLRCDAEIEEGEEIVRGDCVLCLKCNADMNRGEPFCNDPSCGCDVVIQTGVRGKGSPKLVE